MEKILFVCESNSVRSPAAETIAGEQIQRLGLNFQVTSAGLNPNFGYMQYEIREALERMGYTPPMTHTPRRITPRLLDEQSWIFCFEQAQVFPIQDMSPDSAKKVYTLPAFAGEPDQQIPDLNKIARPTLLSEIAMGIRHRGLRTFIYHRLGYIHPDDQEEIINANIQVARVIERYVIKSLAIISKDSIKLI